MKSGHHARLRRYLWRALHSLERRILEASKASDALEKWSVGSSCCALCGQLSRWRPAVQSGEKIAFSLRGGGALLAGRTLSNPLAWPPPSSPRTESKTSAHSR